MSLLEVSSVSSGYNRLIVLHEASLDVEAGEIVAVIGPNGAGKTTLMKTIFRLLALEGGSISYDGRDVSAADPRRIAELGMALVPQERNVFPSLSVEDNLAVSMAGRPRRELAAARAAVYERFPVLEERRRQAASTLSGGERQMLAVGGALITSPRFLALDEPTTGLAPSIVQGLIDQIVELRKEGTTVLWVVEENPLQILRYVDRVYLMEGGSVRRHLKASDVLGDEALRELFFGAGTSGEVRETARG